MFEEHFQNAKESCFYEITICCFPHDLTSGAALGFLDDSVLLKKGRGVVV